MARITDLPNELLTPILIDLRDSSPASLAALASTCKELSHPARIVLSENIFLSWELHPQCSLIKFARHNSQNPYVRSLTIRPSSGLLSGFHVKMNRALDHVEPLCTCLSALPNLTTLSFTVKLIPNDRSYNRNGRMSPEVITAILRSLPPSLVNLELDTDGAEVDFFFKCVDEGPEEHICDAINDLLPRLEVLNLRLGCLCPALFQGFSRNSEKACDGEDGGNDDKCTSRLRRAAINLIFHPGHRNWNTVYTCIPLASYGATPSREDRNRGLTSRSHELVPSKLMREILDVQAAGAFPHLERFIVANVHERSSHSVLGVADAATRTLTQYPFTISVPEDRNGATMDIKHVLHMIRSHDESLRFGVVEALEEAALHEVAWKGTWPGFSRLPVKKPIKHETPQLDPNMLGTMQGRERALYPQPIPELDPALEDQFVTVRKFDEAIVGTDTEWTYDMVGWSWSTRTLKEFEADQRRQRG